MSLRFLGSILAPKILPTLLHTALVVAGFSDTPGDSAFGDACWSDCALGA